MANPQAHRRGRAAGRRDPKRAILGATESLLLDHGEEGFSIRRLSERCGYGAPTIYHYFGDKRGLLDALLEEAFRRLIEELEGVQPRPDALDDLRALAHAFVGFGLRNPRHYALLAARGSDGGGAPESAETARRRLEEPLETLAREGRVATSDLEAAQQSLWIFLHGFVSLQISRPDVAWSPRLLDVGLDALLRGLLRDPPRQRASP